MPLTFLRRRDVKRKEHETKKNIRTIIVSIDDEAWKRIERQLRVCILAQNTGMAKMTLAEEALAIICRGIMKREKGVLIKGRP